MFFAARIKGAHSGLARSARRWPSVLLSLPTGAETTIVCRRAETEIALTGEGGTQLAAARGRCSS